MGVIIIFGGAWRGKMLKKFVSSVVVVTILSLLFSIPVFANGEEKPNTLGDGYEYVHRSDNFENKWFWQHEHYNGGSTTDNVNYMVSRTRSTSVNSKVDVTLKGMAAEVGFGFEVSVGTSDTVSWSADFSIGAGETALLQAGSKWVYAYGTEKRWSNGVLISQKNVSGNWSYRSVTKKTIMN
jgi:hypothetical protein